MIINYTLRAVTPVDQDNMGRKSCKLTERTASLTPSLLWLQIWPVHSQGASEPNTIRISQKRKRGRIQGLPDFLEYAYYVQKFRKVAFGALKDFQTLQHPLGCMCGHLCDAQLVSDATNTRY